MPDIVPLPQNRQLGESVPDRLRNRGGFGLTYLAICPADMQRVGIKKNYPCMDSSRMRGRYVFVTPKKRRSAAKGGETWSAANSCSEESFLRSLK